MTREFYFNLYISDMTETLAHGYSSESTQGELSNEYKQDRVKMIFENHLNPVMLVFIR